MLKSALNNRFHYTSICDAQSILCFLLLFSGRLGTAGACWGIVLLFDRNAGRTKSKIQCLCPASAPLVYTAGWMTNRILWRIVMMTGRNPESATRNTKCVTGENPRRCIPKTTKGKVTEMKFNTVLASSYVLYLSLLLSSKVPFVCGKTPTKPANKIFPGTVFWHVIRNVLENQAVCLEILRADGLFM